MKKVVVSMPMDKPAQDEIVKRIGQIKWLEAAQVTFLHVFKEENYPYMVPPTIYPTKEQKVEIKKTIEEIFDNLQKDLAIAEKKSECVFHPNPKEGMVDYVKKHRPDMVITFTKEKQGLRDYFHSSFTEYMVKHAPCDVMVLR